MHKATKLYGSTGLILALGLPASRTGSCSLPAPGYVLYVSPWATGIQSGQLSAPRSWVSTFPFGCATVHCASFVPCLVVVVVVVDGAQDVRSLGQVAAASRYSIWMSGPWVLLLLLLLLSS